MAQYLQFFQDLWDSWNISVETLAIIGIAGGVLVVFFALVSLGSKPATVRRMHAGGAVRQGGNRFDVVYDDDFDLGGMLKAFVPSSERERTRIGRRIRKSGIKRKNAVYLYYLVRATLGLLLPAAFLSLALLPAAQTAFLPFPVAISELGLLGIFQIAVGLAAFGFYAPALWLTAKIQDRRQRIRNSLPNALDLMQVAVEAGLGFDAAMLRVSRELARTAPDISQEFMMLQLEIQAGKDRHAAFMEMADRADIDEVKAFANVILQASTFGSSVAAALGTFATSLRQERELRAQEKANRLPVQMSAVMALCMMPVLLMICLAPMIIRWVNMFG